MRQTAHDAAHLEGLFVEFGIEPMAETRVGAHERPGEAGLHADRNDRDRSEFAPQPTHDERRDQARGAGRRDGDVGRRQRRRGVKRDDARDEAGSKQSDHATACRRADIATMRRRAWAGQPIGATMRAQSAMARPSHRDKLLSVGARVVREHGFRGASVRDIVQAAGVPQGTFTNHFRTKEAFGLEVIERTLEERECQLDATLRNQALAPLARIGAWIDATIETMKADDAGCGCLFGNLSAEANDAGEPIRERIVSIFDATLREIDACLKAARRAGALPPRTDTRELAAFVLAGFQGAMLIAKARRSVEPVAAFRRVLFKRTLANPESRHSHTR